MAEYYWRRVFAIRITKLSSNSAQPRQSGAKKYNYSGRTPTLKYNLLFWGLTRVLTPVATEQHSRQPRRLDGKNVKTRPTGGKRRLRCTAATSGLTACQSYLPDEGGGLVQLLLLFAFEKCAAVIQAKSVVLSTRTIGDVYRVFRVFRDTPWKIYGPMSTPVFGA